MRSPLCVYIVDIKVKKWPLIKIETKACREHPFQAEQGFKGDAPGQTVHKIEMDIRSTR